MPVIIDLHTHTYPASDDSLLTPDDLIEEAKRAGLDGVCFTEHDRFWPQGELDELSEAHDLVVIGGAEITTDAGHLLVFGLKAFTFGMHRPRFVRELVDEARGFMVAAHPYRRVYREDAACPGHAYDVLVDRTSGDEFFGLADGLETLNGRGSDAENRFSGDLAGRLSLNGTAGSDAHAANDLGRYATEFENPVRCVEELIRELRGGRFRPAVLDASKDPGEPQCTQVERN